MNVDIEEQLRADARAVSRRIDGWPLPPTPASRRHSPLRAPVLVGAALVAATLVALVVVDDGDGRIRTITPAEPVTTQPVAPAITNGSTATPMPLSTEPTEPVATPIGQPLESAAATGAPAAFGTVPDGYRVVLVNEDPATQPGQGTTWLANFVRRPAGDDELAAYIQVQIDPVTDGDPYSAFPGLVLTSDVTMGSFTGKLWNAGPGYQSLVVSLGNDYRMLVGGRADLEDIQTLAEGLSVATDPPGATAATLPDGFELIGQGLTSGMTSSGRWRISYAREQLQESMVMIVARLNPHSSALADLFMPDGGRIVDVNGYTGVESTMGVTFDVSPTYQIHLETGGMLGAAPDIDLLALARRVVAISDDQLATLAQQAAEHPLSPSDMACSWYVTGTDATSNAQLPSKDSHMLVSTPGSVTVTLSSSQPLADVTIGVRSGTNGTYVPLQTVDQLTDPTSVTVTWDGTIDGQLAPADTYQIAIQADPLVPDPGVCVPDDGGQFGSIPVDFVVT